MIKDVYKTGTVVVMVILMAAVTSQAWAWPKLLKKDMADPHGIVIGGDLWFTGTDEAGWQDNKVIVHKIPMNTVITSDNADLTEDTISNITYNPSETWPGDTYTHVGAAEIHEIGANYYLLFNARYTPWADKTYAYMEGVHNETVFYAKYNGGNHNFESPELINALNLPRCVMPNQISEVNFYKCVNCNPDDYVQDNEPTKPHSWYVAANYDEIWWEAPDPYGSIAEEEKRIDIDATIFKDSTNVYMAYTWFNCAKKLGNHNSYFKWDKDGDADGPAKRLTTPSSHLDYAITEAPCIFKKGVYWYMIYSHGLWNTDGYKLMAKKASNLEDLEDANAYYISSGGIGHCGVFMYDNKHYILYHKNITNDGPWRRDVYINELNFDSNDDIEWVE